MTYASYLVCHDQVKEVKEFLQDFFREEFGSYNHSRWVTFQIPNCNFILNLIEGKELKLTQNMVFEIYCDTYSELEDWASKYNQQIEHFTANRASQKYEYYFIDLPGPENICRMEISYSKDI
jgi:hypothetical protein